MLLGGEVDDPARRELPSVEHEHPPRLHLAALTGGGIGLEVLGVGPLELQRHAAAHHAHAVDRIDECLSLCSENVALGVSDHANHGKYQPRQTSTEGR